MGRGSKKNNGHLNVPAGVRYSTSKPANPNVGDIFLDIINMNTYVFDGSSWLIISEHNRITPLGCLEVYSKDLVKE